MALTTNGGPVTRKRICVSALYQSAKGLVCSVSRRRAGTVGRLVSWPSKALRRGGKHKNLCAASLHVLHATYCTTSSSCPSTHLAQAALLTTRTSVCCQKLGIPLSAWASGCEYIYALPPPAFVKRQSIVRLGQFVYAIARRALNSFFHSHQKARRDSPSLSERRE